MVVRHIYIFVCVFEAKRDIGIHLKPKPEKRRNMHAFNTYVINIDKKTSKYLPRKFDGMVQGTWGDTWLIIEALDYY